MIHDVRQNDQFNNEPSYIEESVYFYSQNESSNTGNSVILLDSRLSYIIPDMYESKNFNKHEIAFPTSIGTPDDCNDKNPNISSDQSKQIETPTAINRPEEHSYSYEKLARISNLVKIIFRNALDRNPTSAELRYYGNKIFTGQSSPKDILLSISTSADAKSEIIDRLKLISPFSVNSSTLAQVSSLIVDGMSLNAAVQLFARDVKEISEIYSKITGLTPNSCDINIWSQLYYDGETRQYFYNYFSNIPETTIALANIYLDKLSRLPTAVELTASELQLQSGTSLSNLSISDSTLIPNRPLTDRQAAEFFTNTYNNIFGFSPSSEVVNYNKEQILSGAVSTQDLIRNLADSSDAAAEIAEFYTKFEGSIATAQEIEDAQSQMAQGASFKSVEQSLQLAYDQTAVDHVYQSLLNRSPTYQESMPWVGQIYAGNITIDDLVNIAAHCSEVSSDITLDYQSAFGKAISSELLVNLEDSLQISQCLPNTLAEINFASKSAYFGVTPTVQGVQFTPGLPSDFGLLQVSGFAPAGSLISIEVGSGSSESVIGTAVTQANNSWFFDQNVTLPQGQFNLEASFTNTDVGTEKTPIVNAVTPERIPLSNTTVSLAQFGIAPNTGQDMTAAIQRVMSAMAPGETLVFNPGTYLTSSPLTMNSGTTLSGYGATLQAGNNWVDWAANSSDNMMVTNVDNSLTNRSDTNLSVLGLTFNMNHYEYGGTDSIRFVGVSGVNIQDDNFMYGNDGVALINSGNALINNCSAIDTNNAAYDNWGGSDNVVVENSNAQVIGGYGILFNAVGSDGSHSQVGNFSSVNNSLSVDTANAYWQGAGIWVSPLDDLSSVSNVNIVSTTVDGYDYGIVVGGNVSNINISNNNVENTNGAGITIRQEGEYAPTFASINQNTLFNNLSPVSIQSNNSYDVSGNIISNVYAGGLISASSTSVTATTPSNPDSAGGELQNSSTSLSSSNSSVITLASGITENSYLDGTVSFTGTMAQFNGINIVGLMHGDSLTISDLVPSSAQLVPSTANSIELIASFPSSSMVLTAAFVDQGAPPLMLAVDAVETKILF